MGMGLVGRIAAAVSAVAAGPLTKRVDGARPSVP
jgi:hypothetical protein